MPRPLGVYVHFPYCTHRCPYCDFAVTTEAVPGERRYARAVLAELALRAPAFDGLAPVSLYLGGGTPSLWDPDEVADVIAAIRERLRFPSDAEVTIEANPESCDRERLRRLRAAGVNRVSVGVQSFDPGVLAKLGRRHGPDAADAEVLAEEVPLARMRREGRLPLPTEDDAARQGAAIRAALRRAGLRRYEISNFARPGRESVHNRLYWEGESYLGLGAGAYGCLHAAGGALRYGNARDARTYLELALDGRLPTAEEDRVDARAARNERLMLALRTRRGADLGALSAAQAREAGEAVRRRLAVRRAGRLVLTSRGMDLHSALAERLFE